MTLLRMVKKYSRARGATLVELMVAAAILSVGILGFFGAFRFITISLHVSRTRTLATNLAQEKIEALKNISYYELLITTHTASDPSFTPSLVYDDSNYPPENITIGGVTFTRYTFVTLAQIDNNVISTVTYTFPDTGMKQITVNVVWTDRNEKKRWTLTNLLENPNVNPLDGSLTGTVNSADFPSGLAGAYVRVEQNPDWNDETDSGGSYSFRVYHGSYTIRASSAGYYDAVTTLQNVTLGSNVTVPQLTMTAIATGTIGGEAWLNTDLVISGVMVSSQQYGQSQSGEDFAPGGTPFVAQYVELFNPTTADIDIGQTGLAPQVKLGFGSWCPADGDSLCDDSTDGIPLVYTSTFVPAGHYYLIANTGTFMLNGQWVTPDAVYADNVNDKCFNMNTLGYDSLGAWNTGSSPPKKQVALAGHGGTFWLKRGTTFVDAVGWTHTPNSPPYCETACINVDATGNNGMPDGDQIVRLSSPAATLALAGMDTYAHAYDAGDNQTDFAYDNIISGIQYNPHDLASGSFPIIAGKPAIGALIAASDDNSGASTVMQDNISSGSWNLPFAVFALPGVTTSPAPGSCAGDCWTLTIASGSYYNVISTISITQGQVTYVPNADTSPAWPFANQPETFLSSSSLNGYVKGTVSDINGAALSGIDVVAGGTSKTTGSNGMYFISTSSGTITITVNPNNANPKYVQLITDVVINTGQVLGQNFTLSQGGSVTGYVTSGTTPLPNYVITATIGGSQYGSASSNTSGVFTIRNLSTGTYSVSPTLDPGQDSNPNSVSVTVLSTATVSIGTFTVSGAYGSIAGTIQVNGASLTSGALIIASTATIPSTPVAIAASSAPAQTPIYAVSSLADGTFDLPVRGGSTYNLSAYVPTIGSNGSVSITTKTYSGIAVSPSAATTQDITVP